MKSRSTEWRNKKRGYETDREYTNSDFAPQKRDAEVKHFLKLKRINRKQLSSIAELRLNTLIFDDARVTNQEYIALKTEATRLRTKIKDFIDHPSEKGFKCLIADKRLKKYLIFEHKVIDRFRKNDQATFSSEEEKHQQVLLAGQVYNEIRIL